MENLNSTIEKDKLIEFFNNNLIHILNGALILTMLFLLPLL